MDVSFRSVLSCTGWLAVTVKSCCLFHQLPAVRAPVGSLQQTHLAILQADMIAPVMKLMTVPAHTSVEV